jgi:hypothetical protein
LTVTYDQAGLVDPAEQQRKDAKSQWAKRYDERNTQSTHIGAGLEDGETGDNYIPESDEAIAARERRRNEGLWGRTDEEYYNEGECRRACMQAVVWFVPELIIKTLPRTSVTGIILQTSKVLKSTDRN